MSWLYGYLYKEAPKGSPLLLTAQKALQEKHLPFFDLYAGGSSNTLFWFEFSDTELLVVLGMPVICEMASCRYPSISDWQNCLKDPDRFLRLDGHFAILHYKQGTLSCYNDSLGKRTLYFRESDTGIFFCSDLSLLKAQGSTEIDYYKYGALWHAMYPPTQGGYAPLSDTYYKGVLSLGTGAKACYHPGQDKLKISNRPFEPSPQALDSIQMLESYCLLPAKTGKRIGIGL